MSKSILSLRTKTMLYPIIVGNCDISKHQLVFTDCAKNELFYTRLPLARAKWVQSTISSLYCLLLYASALSINLGIIKKIGMGGFKPVTAGWEAQILPLCCVFYFYFITMFVKKLFDKTKTDCSDCRSSLRTRDHNRNWL